VTTEGDNYGQMYFLSDRMMNNLDIMEDDGRNRPELMMIRNWIESPLGTAVASATIASGIALLVALFISSVPWPSVEGRCPHS